MLDEKISMFELVVGEVGAILGGLEEERDFAELVLDAWLKRPRPVAPKRSMRWDVVWTRRGQQHEGAKALDEALFGEDFETA